MGRYLRNLSGLVNASLVAALSLGTVAVSHTLINNPGKFYGLSANPGIVSALDGMRKTVLDYTFDYASSNVKGCLEEKQERSLDNCIPETIENGPLLGILLSEPSQKWALQQSLYFKFEPKS